MTSAVGRSPWHAVVHTALASQPGTMVEATAALWKRLLPELCLILGDGAFKPLYSRSLRVTSSSYPWLLQNKVNFVDGDVVAQLSMLLQGQQAAVAREASIALFVTFFELLASLIGDALTERILGGIGPSDFEIITKERPQ